MNPRHKFIVENYSTMPTSEIAEVLGMTVDSVVTTASKLGVRKFYEVDDLEGEEWRTHADYPDFLISNKGRVKSKIRNTLIYQRVHEGYYDCRINNANGEKKSPRVHRLVAESFISNPEDKPIVNHIDGNKLNNSANNLEWCTYSENNAHARKNGLTKYRTDTLKEFEVEHICMLLAQGKTIKQVQATNDRYTRSRVEKIRQRKRWTRISDAYKW